MTFPGMTFDEFKASLAVADPPSGLPVALLGLWHQGRGDWEKAHQTVQADGTTEAAWVHAHLHRVEGDEANAGYWFRRAGQPHGDRELGAEWEAISRALLGDGATR